MGRRDEMRLPSVFRALGNRVTNPSADLDEATLRDIAQAQWSIFSPETPSIDADLHQDRRIGTGDSGSRNLSPNTGALLLATDSKSWLSYLAPTYRYLRRQRGQAAKP